jgi:hypothetical protein
MFRRYVIIINVLLIAGSLFLLNRIFRTWGADDYPKSAPIKKENVANLPALKINFSPHKSKNDYQVIVDKDLFRPERTEWKSPTQEGENVSARVPPQIVVYGIVITKASKYVWIQEQGKIDKLLKIPEGGDINGWKVITIEANAIRVKSGDQILTFNLIQPNKPKTRTIPRPSIQTQPKKITNPTPNAESEPALKLVPQPPPVPPPPALPQKQ